MKRVMSLLLIVGVLSGCTAVPPLNFAVSNVEQSTRKIDADLRSMTVTIAQPDESTGPLASGLSRANATSLWQTALQDALNHQAIFEDDSLHKVNLSVKILKFDPPAFGASMTTTVEAKYELLDRKNGKILFSKSISSDGVVSATYAFAGIVRAQESINRAVENNITQFLQYLQTVDLSML